jgi:hypothetical protein
VVAIDLSPPLRADGARRIGRGGRLAGSLKQMESDGLSGYGSELREIADITCKPEGTIFVAESMACGNRGAPELDAAGTAFHTLSYCFYALNRFCSI